MFWTELVGVEPMRYRWFRAYPWETNWVEVTGATNWYFVITNVDSWVDGTVVMCWVSNAVGEAVWLGPEYLMVDWVKVYIPATNYVTGAGPASRYPMTINVFGLLTNPTKVTITVRDLYHTRSSDLRVLLVSPTGKPIMLMSGVGGTNGVSNATLVFERGWPVPPEANPIPSNQTTYYSPCNYKQKTQLPGAPAGPYSVMLQDLEGENPNGVWRLYVYDDTEPAGVGQLIGSWVLDFNF
jgi:subtilisin-like proprotein convertase family protein